MWMFTLFVWLAVRWACDDSYESIFTWRGCCAVWFVHLDKHFSAKQIRP